LKKSADYGKKRLACEQSDTSFLVSFSVVIPDIIDRSTNCLLPSTKPNFSKGLTL
jgi:hypothetical protein